MSSLTPPISSLTPLTLSTTPLKTLMYLLIFSSFPSFLKHFSYQSKISDAIRMTQKSGINKNSRTNLKNKFI